MTNRKLHRKTVFWPILIIAIIASLSSARVWANSAEVKHGEYFEISQYPTDTFKLFRTSDL
ncbi:hypothetical protein [uncultured Kriegella sp.]|uniref:hypothetical protein n=1 Tax=uncultured Kriegella sp. TaxID=1798910 RepID=UPI0030D71722